MTERAASAPYMPKPEPRLRERPPDRARRLVDLAWLLRVLARAVPRPCALWALVAIV